MDAVWWIVAVLAIFGIVILSVGQVLLRGPGDSEVPRGGGWLLLIGGAMLVTALILALGRLVGLL
jgi:hypothetical protein